MSVVNGPFNADTDCSLSRAVRASPGNYPIHSDLGIDFRQLAGTDRTRAGINKVEDSGPARQNASVRRGRMIAKLFGAAAIGAVPDAPHSADLKAGALLLPRHARATTGMEN